MNCAVIQEILQSRLSLLFSCQEERGRVKISTPYLYPDGDYVDLYLWQTPEGWILTDAGETAGYLADYGVRLQPSPKRRKIVDDVLLTHGVEWFQGELRLHLAKEDDISTPLRAWLVETLSSSSRSYANFLVSRTVRIWHDIHRTDGRYGYITLIDDSTDVWKPEWLDQLAAFSEVTAWSQREALLRLLKPQPVHSGL